MEKVSCLCVKQNLYSVKPNTTVAAAAPIVLTFIEETHLVKFTSHEGDKEGQLFSCGSEWDIITKYKIIKYRKIKKLLMANENVTISNK